MAFSRPPIQKLAFSRPPYTTKLNFRDPLPPYTKNVIYETPYAKDGIFKFKPHKFSSRHA